MKPYKSSSHSSYADWDNYKRLFWAKKDTRPEAKSWGFVERWAYTPSASSTALRFLNNTSYPCPSINIHSRSTKKSFSVYEPRYQLKIICHGSIWYFFSINTVTPFFIKRLLFENCFMFPYAPLYMFWVESWLLKRIENANQGQFNSQFRVTLT